MSATVNYEDYISLSKYVQIVNPLDTFVSTNFFKTKNDYLTDTIIFEKELMDTTGIARFILKDGSPYNLKKMGKDSKIFTLPETSEKFIYTIQEYNNWKSPLGNRIINSQERMSSWNAEITKNAKNLKRRTLNKAELMCIMAITSGAISFTEDGVTWEADFGWSTYSSDTAPGQKKTLAGDYRWGETKATVYQDVLDAVEIVQRNGKNVSAILMDKLAAQFFLQDETVLKFLNNLNYTAGVGKPANLMAGIGAAPIFTFPGGSPTIYKYSQFYKNATGTMLNMMPDYTCAIIADNPDTELARGTIQRFQEGSNTPEGFAEYMSFFAQDQYRTCVEQILNWKAMPVCKNPLDHFVLTVYAQA